MFKSVLVYWAQHNYWTCTEHNVIIVLVLSTTQLLCQPKKKRKTHTSQVEHSKNTILNFTLNVCEGNVRFMQKYAVQYEGNEKSCIYTPLNVFHFDCTKLSTAKCENSVIWKNVFGRGWTNSYKMGFCPTFWHTHPSAEGFFKKFDYSLTTLHSIQWKSLISWCDQRCCFCFQSSSV